MSKTIKITNKTKVKKKKFKKNSKYPIDFKIEEYSLRKKKKNKKKMALKDYVEKKIKFNEMSTRNFKINNKNKSIEMKLKKKNKDLSKNKQIHSRLDKNHYRTKSNFNVLSNNSSSKESVLEKFFPNFNKEILKKKKNKNNSKRDLYKSLKKKSNNNVHKISFTKTLIKREKTFNSFNVLKKKKDKVDKNSKKFYNFNKKKAFKKKNSKEKNIFKNIDLTPIFKNEEYLYKFFDLIYKSEDIYDLFKEYIDFIQDQNLEPFLEFFDSKIKKNYKSAFILERTTLMLCFYLLITKKYKREIIFLKKLIFAVYSNMYSFIFLLINLMSEDQISFKNQNLISQMITRDFQKYDVKLSKNVCNNNQKCLKYIELQLKTLKPDILNSIMKIIEFVDDFGLSEGFNYLFNIFSELYQEKGLIKKETPTKKKIIKKDISIPVNNNSEKSLENSIDKSSFLSDITKKENYVLVLDLDETLVHFDDEGGENKVYFRPYVEKFLKKMHEYYEIIIFTAALKEYADPIIDYLDPENKMITKRFYRRDTLFVNGEYSLKDLEKVGKDLSKVIIIDNIPENFNKQIKNGIFIKSWYGDDNDTCLLGLIPILEEVVNSSTPDVRIFLSDYKRKLIEKINKGSLNPQTHL